MGKTETVQQLSKYFGEEARKRLNGAIIKSPWDSAISAQDRATQHMYLLQQTYGNGHPGCREPIESLMERQSAGRLLTWIIYWQGYPVGMANLEITDSGTGELCRTVELPKGTKIDEGLTYEGQVKTSAVTYQRISDALTHPEITKKIWALEADLRMAKEITLPSGKTLEAGVKTQHINKALNPMLLSVPRYEVSPEHGHAHQEVFLQSRLYFEPEAIDKSQPIYTPEKIDGKITVADIVSATYNHAFGFSPKIVGDHGAETRLVGSAELKNTAGEHFSTLTLSGNVDVETILEKVHEGLVVSRFLEIVVPNLPENIPVQKKLYELGIIPMGVMPGGEFSLNGNKIIVPTTIHYGTARQHNIRQMVEVGLAQDYEGGDIEKISLALREEWRKKLEE